MTPARVTGPFGAADRLPDPKPDRPQLAQLVTHWLITAPQAHPLWSQYLIFAVQLKDDVEGLPAPVRHFPTATHEIVLFALEPREDNTRYTITDIAAFVQSGKVPFLQPINIVHQVEATDGEVERLVADAAWSVVTGALWPETADAPERVRNVWATTLTATLAHLRGEVHQS